jgi:hypothetical protein
MTTTVAQRFEHLINTLELDCNSFSKSIYANHMDVKKIINHKGKPSFDMIANILSIYPNISAEWLIIGKGSVWANEEIKKRDSKIEELRYIIEIQKQLLEKNNILIHTT